MLSNIPITRHNPTFHKFRAKKTGLVTGLDSLLILCCKERLF